MFVEAMLQCSRKLCKCKNFAGCCVCDNYRSTRYGNENSRPKGGCLLFRVNAFLEAQSVQINGIGYLAAPRT